MSYGKIGLTAMAVTQDLHSGMPLVLKNKNSSVLGTVYYLNLDNPVPIYMVWNALIFSHLNYCSQYVVNAVKNHRMKYKNISSLLQKLQAMGNI